MTRRVCARIGAAGLALALCAASGCAWLLPALPPRLAECPGPQPSTRELPAGDWWLRESARYVGGRVDVGFDLVAEKRGGRLVLVGFHALGAKAFSIVQEGDDVKTQSHLGRALQVPPETVLRDFYASGLADASAADRAEVSRPECGYTATFVRVERRALGRGDP